MKAFLDTSVLVPVALGDHEHHEACLDLFIRYPKADSCCAAHSLAEVYSVLTKLPGKHRIAPDQAMLFVTNLRERPIVVSLTGDEYAQALANAAVLGMLLAALLRPGITASVRSPADAVIAVLAFEALDRAKAPPWTAV